MKPITIIKTGKTFPDLIDKNGDFEDWISRGIGLPNSEIKIVNAESDILPEPDQIRGAIISGSHAYVTDNLDWCLRLEHWTKMIIDNQMPLLGICFGHQVIAKAMGGIVDFHPISLEIGTKEIELLPSCENDPLFTGLPARFKVHLFHSQSVIQLPANTTVLARNEFEPHQAVRVGKNAWGVQFHPEANSAATRGYIQNLLADVKSADYEPDQLFEQIEETPYSASLLKRFVELI
nr:glutamine amidotransferase [uncultured Desulfobacter sp.]